MLLVAAALLGCVAAMHSVLGERHLIAPVCQLQGLPALFGHRDYARLTLRAGWHITSLLWLGLAGLLVYLQFFPDALRAAYLWMVAIVFFASGVIALTISRGKHPSWALFLPVSAICTHVALSN